MLPTIPGGQSGSRWSPQKYKNNGSPSLPSAFLAQVRVVVNSEIRLSTARTTSAASSGNSDADGSSASVATEATYEGSNCSIICYQLQVTATSNRCETLTNINA